MVTAELALTFPAVVLVLLICLSALAWGVDQVRCVDAARVAVRELARGETQERALADAGRAGPSGAEISVDRSGRDVSVSISAEAPTTLAWVGAGTQCSATARMEPADAEA